MSHRAGTITPSLWGLAKHSSGRSGLERNTGRFVVEPPTFCRSKLGVISALSKIGITTTAHYKKGDSNEKPRCQWLSSAARTRSRIRVTGPRTSRYGMMAKTAATINACPG